MSDNYNRLVFGLIVFVAFVAFVAMIFTKQVPTDLRDVVIAISGVLATNVNTIVQFFFGSSSGSAKKDDTITSLSASKQGG